MIRLIMRIGGPEEAEEIQAIRDFYDIDKH
jgi:hypothetical protein